MRTAILIGAWMIGEAIHPGLDLPDKAVNFVSIAFIVMAAADLIDVCRN